MSDIDRQALETLFENWRKDRAAQLKPSKAFERFVIDQVLKDIDPSDEDIDSGDLGGGDDGGIDAMYLLMNGSVLVTEETDIPDPTTGVELILIQAKNENGFSETAVEKIKSFCADLLDYSKAPSSFTYLNSDARDAIKNFRERYSQVFALPHTMKVSIHYATRADREPGINDKVTARVNNLKQLIKAKLSQSEVEFVPWTCSTLLGSARALPQKDEVIVITKSFSADDGSVVCLVSLKEFAAFLTNRHGKLKTAMLEPNVRDYQGEKNTVNKEIRETLNDRQAKEEFWWLNNGITILATACVISGNQMKISDPEIVNGLQTSHEIFNSFSGRNDLTDKRSVLVRVVRAADERSRNKVIKATNSQTPVDVISLRATDRIHFDIEDRLKLYGLFYDRKKGQYRRLRKDISSIVSVKALAQAAMSALLQRPDEARARPKSLLTDPDQYGGLFDDTHNRDMYVSSIVIDRQVEAFLASERRDGTYLTRDEKRNVHYYVVTLVTCELTQMAHPTAQAIAATAGRCVSGIPSDILERSTATALRLYTKLGANDNLAKGPSLRVAMLQEIEERFNQRGV